MEWYPTINVNDSSSDEYSDTEIEPPVPKLHTTLDPDISSYENDLTVHPPGPQVSEQLGNQSKALNQSRQLKKKTE